MADLNFSSMRALLSGALLGVLLFVCVPSWAVEATAASKADAKRFHLDRSSETVWKSPSGRDLAALQSFRRGNGLSTRVKYHPRTGAPEIVTGFTAAASGATPEASARAFLDAQKSFLKVDTSELTLALQRGPHHLLFKQTHLGVPVEFSRIGVHFDENGRVHYLQSNFDPAITTPPTPTVTRAAALQVVSQDIGAPVSVPGSLVYFPDDSDGKMHLAWKFTFNSRKQGGLWNYYVDAGNGSLLLRYDAMEYQTYVTSGTVNGSIFAINPFGSPDGSPALAPFENEAVYVVNGASSSLTDVNGFYSFGEQGRVFSTLRGPYVVVSNEHYPNETYDNGLGQWVSIPTPISTAHPYANGANQSWTIQGPTNPLGFAGNAVRMRVHFSDYDVGEDDGSNESTSLGFDDDETDILDANGNKVANYIAANRGAFLSADVPGNSITLNLVANDNGVEGNGFDVDVSSYFVWGIDPTSPGTPASYNIVWSSATSYDNTWDESNAFYHLNVMHDFMTALGGSNPEINLSTYPVIATVHASNDLLNAFFNPANQGLYFGDGLTNDCQLRNGVFINCSFALDATVLHHEYTHFVVNHIYPIENFGQFGAISEGIADYFSATSLNTPTIGQFVTSGFGGLRDLDDGIGNGSNVATMCTAGNCSSLPASWTGEIHADSPLISQALWDIRQYFSANPVTGGEGEADQLTYQTLFYFPGSFDEFREAYLDIAENPNNPSSNAAAVAFIKSAFSVHGISGTVSGLAIDREPNDGPSTAIDASSSSVWVGNIYPIADLDYYSIDAAVGQVQVTLTQPQTGITGQYEGLGISLVDRYNNILAQAEPAVSNSDGGGVCPAGGDCYTAQPTLTLTYQNKNPGYMYVVISCGVNDSGSIGGCSNPNPYTMNLALTPANQAAGAGVSAVQANSEVSFSMPLPAYARGEQQVWSFSHARLRDQDLRPMFDTDSSGGAVPLSIVQTPTIANNVMSGVVSINPGTAARYPAVGSVYLELFGVNQFGNQQSLGYSQELGLTAGTAGGSFTAYNNIINPTQGQKATLKATVNGSGNLTIKLYTLIGESLKTLYDGPVNGSYSVDWDGHNAAGATVASGVYLIHAEGPGVSKTVKVVVIK